MTDKIDAILENIPTSFLIITKEILKKYDYLNFKDDYIIRTICDLSNKYQGDCNFKNYENKLKETLEEYTKELLNNSYSAFTILNKYINLNLKWKKTSSSNSQEFLKFMYFLNGYDYKINQELCFRLIEENINFYNIVNSVIQDETLYCDNALYLEMISPFIEAYQIINDSKEDDLDSKDVDYYCDSNLKMLISSIPKELLSYEEERELLSKYKDSAFCKRQIGSIQFKISIEICL